MLIRSPRHTSADLECWKELERADRARSHSRMLGRNYRRCAEWAKEFLQAGPAWCGVSWGKDSVLLAHLLLSIDKSVPLRFVRVEPIVNPDCAAVRDAFLATHACDYQEAVVHCTSDASGVHATGTLEAGFRAICGELGERYVSGVRTEESGMRSLRFMSYGANTHRTSAPLSLLPTSDVFALLYRERLPIHPAYAMLGGGRWDRHRIRVASLGGKRGDGHGRAEWEQEYYGDVLRRLTFGP